MKQLLAAGVMVLVGLGIAGAQPAPGKAASPSQAIIDLEHQWIAASKAANGDALAALLADSFVALDSDGTLHTKADVVARTKKAKWVTNEIGDLKVVMHGDTAIATGTWAGNGTDGTGKAVNAKERWADTWVKMAGKWQCVSSASAPSK